MGTRSGAHPGLLRPGTGCVRGRQRRWSRVVPAWAARGLSTGLSGEPRLFREYQPQQHSHQQLLQQPERDQCRIRQPASARSRRRRADDRVRAVAAGVQGGGAGDAGNGCRRAGNSYSGHRADREKRAWGRRPGRQAAAPRVRAACRRPHGPPCATRRFRGATAATDSEAGQTARRRRAQGIETRSGRAGTRRQSDRADSKSATDHASAAGRTRCQTG